MRYLVLCVIYKTNPSNSITLFSLAECRCAKENIRVIVWDNSPLRAESVELEWLARNFSNVEYRHSPQNVPLSSAYNTAIREYFLGSISEYDALVLLDQDSSFGPDLFSKATEAAEKYPDADLFLPFVKANGKIISPASLYWFKGVSWGHARSGLVHSRFRAAINSGMIIRSRYLVGQFPGYDERLRFYGTDNYFLQEYAKTQLWLCVLDVEIQHDLARNRDEGVETKLWRHLDNVRALYLLNEKGWVRRTCCQLYCLLYSAKIALQHRDRRFLKWR